MDKMQNTTKFSVNNNEYNKKKRKMHVIKMYQLTDYISFFAGFITLNQDFFFFFYNSVFQYIILQCM